MTMDMTKNRAAGEVSQAEPIRQGPVFVPHADIYEDEGAYRVWLDMPGCDPKEIDIRYEKGLLTISGKAAARHGEKTSWLLSEYGVGDYQRTFNVTDTIDSGRIAAEYEDGVLALTLPKVEAARPKKIEVRTK